MDIKYRGGVRIDYSRCTGCGTCYEVCPADIFGYDAQSKLVTVDYPDECCYCDACIYECPAKGAIRLEFPLACL